MSKIVDLQDYYNKESFTRAYMVSQFWSIFRAHYGKSGIHISHDYTKSLGCLSKKTIYLSDISEGMLQNATSTRRY